ncbi:hypothetical protein EVAR_100576_1 [Eumeta japonica]|uniref:Uncharacterized protein n=1 Tax=Eumeta variegata TaxID=151549 RepID=A0A4C1YA39_EUMVA|nr:hypothetical protein EVAR_100576_1 [Eumeta japonica]
MLEESLHPIVIIEISCDGALCNARTNAFNHHLKFDARRRSRGTLGISETSSIMIIDAIRRFNWTPKRSKQRRVRSLVYCRGSDAVWNSLGILNARSHRRAAVLRMALQSASWRLSRCADAVSGR